ncbi:MAG: phytoene/squalene synthase family protein [Pirellulales bacterium]
MSAVSLMDGRTSSSAVSLAESYAHCARTARKAASNFYLAFWLLPRDRRRATCALYAFLRRSDDIGDDDIGDASVALRRERLSAWRASLDRALAGEFDDPLLPALADTVNRYAIPRECLFDALDGVAMDLVARRYETADDLREYCYRVASVVGLACIHIWGFRGKEAFEPARHCGLAFQWTNILRDLGEDAARGRVYLPLDSLRRHDYRPEELLAGVADDRLSAVLDEQIAIAREHFAAAAPLFSYLSADGRRALAAMYHTYRDLLDRVARAGGDVLHRRVRVPTWRKVQLAGKALVARNRRGDFDRNDRTDCALNRDEAAAP